MKFFLVILSLLAVGGPLFPALARADATGDNFQPWMSNFLAAQDQAWDAQKRANPPANPAAAGPDFSQHDWYPHTVVPQHPDSPSVRVGPTEKVIYCKSGTVLSLAGNVIDATFSSCALEADRRVVAIDEASKVAQQYLFNWTAAEKGTHILKVVFTPRDGSRPIVACSVTVKVQDAAPFSLDSLSDALEADATTPISHASVADFKPANIDVIVNDTGFSLPLEQAQLSIPTRRMPEGDYTFAIVAYEADGTRWVSLPKTVHLTHPKSG